MAGRAGWVLAVIFRLLPLVFVATGTAAASPATGPLRWISLPVEATAAGDFVLSFGVADVEALLVRLDHGGQSRLLLVQTPDSGFATRPIAAPMLALPVQLQAGASTLVVGYQLHADTPLQLRLRPAAEYDRWQAARHLLDGVLLGLFVAMIVVALLHFFTLRSPEYLLYVATCAMVLAFLAQIGGYGFMYLWPQAPAWNQVAPILFTGGVQLAHLAFTIRLLDLRRRAPRLRRAMLLIVAAVPAGFAAFFLTGELAPLFALSVLYTPLLLIAGLGAVRDGVPGARFFLAGAAALVLFVNLAFGAGVVGGVPLPGGDVFLYPKLGYLIEAACFAGALADRVRVARAQAETALRLRLIDAEELARAEVDKYQALRTAHDRQLELAASGHDLAQPLQSIRLALTAMRDDEDNRRVRAHVDRALDLTRLMLDELIQGARRTPGVLPLDLADVFEDLAERHASQAAAKRMRLCLMPTSARIETSQLVLTRILDNLIGNALRYGRSRVVAGVRHRPDAILIEVHDDGPGIDPAQRDRLLAPFVQGGSHAAEVEGFGLGLHIVQRLSAQSGFGLDIRARPGRGSVFTISIPHRGR
ncbi:sensor histidine kinase [Tistrella mobilis]|uniref:sensor histidine kinase n=1 Tax=Tistrella mobilis TaxID=171437 RepID=UPI003558F09F